MHLDDNTDEFHSDAREQSVLLRRGADVYTLHRADGFLHYLTSVFVFDLLSLLHGNGARNEVNNGFVFSAQ